MHSHTVAFPSFLQTGYIRNIAVVKKLCFEFVFISLGKWHPLWSCFQETNPYNYVCVYMYGTMLMYVSLSTTGEYLLVSV